VREIKFRAWNTEIKTMCHDNEDNSAEYWDWANSSVVGLVNFQLNSKYNSNYVFMQYTGLKDKNWVEIFENDLVMWSASTGWVYQITFIEWGYCLTRPDLKWCPIDINTPYPSTWCQLEIKGNIYETPKLLLERSEK
jgi:uncharacterized phage protein (TIGR01671 family)